MSHGAFGLIRPSSRDSLLTQSDAVEKPLQGRFKTTNLTVVYLEGGS